MKDYLKQLENISKKPKNWQWNLRELVYEIVADDLETGEKRKIKENGKKVLFSLIISQIIPVEYLEKEVEYHSLGNLSKEEKTFIESVLKLNIDEESFSYGGINDLALTDSWPHWQYLVARSPYSHQSTLESLFEKNFGKHIEEPYSALDKSHMVLLALSRNPSLPSRISTALYDKGGVLHSWIST